MKIKAQLVVLLSALLFALGGFAYGNALSGLDSNKVIYGCVTGINGNITKVSYVDHSCPRGSTVISWNQQGSQGIQGDPGPMGLPGLPGTSTTSNGMIPWYLADASGKAVAVPLDFTKIPTSGNIKIQVLVNGLLASVNMESGAVTEPDGFSSNPAILFGDSTCSAEPRTWKQSMNSYIVANYNPTKHAYTGNQNSYQMSAARSTNNTGAITSAILALFTSTGKNIYGMGGSGGFPAFETTVVNPYCYAFTATDLENYYDAMLEQAKLNLSYSGGSDYSQFITASSRFKDFFLTYPNYGLDEVQVVENFGPLTFTPNY